MVLRELHAWIKVTTMKDAQVILSSLNTLQDRKRLKYSLKIA
jgi:hypothetical protein